MGLLNFFGFFRERKLISKEPIAFESNLYHFDQEDVKDLKVSEPIHPMVLQYYKSHHQSTMSGARVESSVLYSLFEAARWAPSSFNVQNWRFVFVTPDSVNWSEWLTCVPPSNRELVNSAGALVVVISKKSARFTAIGLTIETASFEAGAAFMSIALEGSARGLTVRSVEGFDRSRLERTIQLTNHSTDYCIDALVAIGHPVTAQPPIDSNSIVQPLKVDQFITRGVLAAA